MAVEKSYEKTQIGAFAALVNDGTYAEDFDHAPQAQEFFKQAMTVATSYLVETDTLSVLDCGCGNGAWLDFLAAKLPSVSFKQYFGYDLTPEMVAVTERRLSRLGETALFQTGNILEDSAYQFAGHGDQFDLIFTYDVVQQLPPKMQFAAIESLLEHLAEGGVAVVFDNDSNSAFGRTMARKKFLTRYLRLNLVPRYYCNASYPPLAKMGERLAALDQFTTEVKVSESGMKRALIIRKLSSP